MQGTLSLDRSPGLKGLRALAPLSSYSPHMLHLPKVLERFAVNSTGAILFILLLETHIFLNVSSEARMEPPIHVEYSRS